MSRKLTSQGKRVKVIRDLYCVDLDECKNFSWSVITKEEADEIVFLYCEKGTTGVWVEDESCLYGDDGKEYYGISSEYMEEI